MDIFLFKCVDDVWAFISICLNEFLECHICTFKWKESLWNTSLHLKKPKYSLIKVVSVQASKARQKLDKSVSSFFWNRWVFAYSIKISLLLKEINFDKTINKSYFSYLPLQCNAMQCKVSIDKWFVCQLISIYDAINK